MIEVVVRKGGHDVKSLMVADVDSLNDAQAMVALEYYKETPMTEIANLMEFMQDNSWESVQEMIDAFNDMQQGFEDIYSTAQQWRA